MVTPGETPAILTPLTDIRGKGALGEGAEGEGAVGEAPRHWSAACFLFHPCSEGKNSACFCSCPVSIKLKREFSAGCYDIIMCPWLMDGVKTLLCC
jgi:hypothetical protein